MIKKVLDQEVEFPGLGRKQLTDFACFINKHFDYEELKKSDLIYSLEFIIPNYFDNDFTLDCISADEWNYNKGKSVICDYYNHSIIIRDDIYCAAYEQKPKVNSSIKRAVRKYLLMLYSDLSKKEADSMKNRKNSSY